MDTVYVVEIESGCTDFGNAMMFNSVWDNYEDALAYCEKRYSDWVYRIEAVVLNTPN